MTGSPAPGDRRVFHGLDGLRGLAALFVVCWHAQGPGFSSAFPGSYLAVDLFFVLSGFVIAHAYDARFRAGLSAGRFMVTRIIRLYPLYILATAIAVARVVALRLTHHPDPLPSAVELVTAALFLPTPNTTPPENLFPLDFPAWSLVSELAINLVFALVATRLAPRRLGVLLAVGAVLLIATGVHFGSLNAGVSWPEAIGGPGRVVFTFFAGIACRRLLHHPALERIRLPAWASVAVLVAIFAVPDGPWRAAFDIGVALVVMPLLVLATARTEPGGLLGRVFPVLGTASYAIYVLHMPIRSWLKSLALAVAHRPFEDFGVAGTIGFAATTVAAALILDRFYDVPVRTFLTRQWRRVRG